MGLVFALLAVGLIVGAAAGQAVAGEPVLRWSGLGWDCDPSGMFIGAWLGSVVGVIVGAVAYTRKANQLRRLRDARDGAGGCDG